MMRVSAYDVREALRPALGSVLAENMELCNRVADVMRQYTPGEAAMTGMKEDIQDIIFNAVYDHAGERMTVRRDDGSIVRIYMRDLPMIADDAMGALFMGLPVYSANYQTLKEYALREGSLAAMRVLFEKYDRLMTEEETQTLIRVIRGYPEWRWAGWLRPGVHKETEE